MYKRQVLNIPQFLMYRNFGWVDSPYYLALIVPTLFAQETYFVYMLIQFMRNIPRELDEAAKIDGASRWQTLWKVTIPNVMPSITICTFLTLTNGFKLFDQNLALTGGMPSNRSQLLALNIYDTFYGRAGWEGAGQAKAVVFCLIVVTIALLQLRLTRTREVQQ